jgi:DMSO/TMAO reductase YedYZ molybdopterin-dependent catalytic subunit
VFLSDVLQAAGELLMPSRRTFLQAGSMAAAGLCGGLAAAAEETKGAGAGPMATPAGGDVPAPPEPHPVLTPAGSFRDVSRGSPKPHSLTGDALTAARLTPESWRLEVVVDPFTSATVPQPASSQAQFRLDDDTAIDLPRLLELGKTAGVRYLKAVQCLNIPQPLGQGLWEGVPLREVLRLCGPLSNVRRVYYHGFHNHDPKQLFRSSLSYSQAMEHAPGDPPVFLAYRLNGEPIPLVRGGPVRLIVPWAYGFKSIKWLQRISLTNDYQANDTYATQNNDPDSPMKTAAYFDPLPKQVPAGVVYLSGQVVSGFSGLARVEYSLERIEPGERRVRDSDGGDSDSAAVWKPCDVQPEPDDWTSQLPAGVRPADVLGFDRQTNRATVWPFRYGSASWQVALERLEPGTYEARVRAVDLNGFAQPEPRPILKAGRNGVEVHRFEVEDKAESD